MLLKVVHVWLQVTNDGWSDIPFDQQALHLPDSPAQSNFTDYAIGRDIRECPCVAHFTDMLESFPMPLSPKNVSLALEKLAVLGSSPPLGNQENVCSTMVQKQVCSICAGMERNAAAQQLDMPVAARSLWALAEMASMPPEAGGPLINRDDKVVQVCCSTFSCIWPRSQNVQCLQTYLLIDVFVCFSG